MSYLVNELPRAEADVRGIFEWLHERAPQGARNWLAAYDEMLVRLESMAGSFAEAPESSNCEFDVRQAFFKTRRGRIYRALYFIENKDVYILRVRGPGQAFVDPEYLK